MEHFLPKKIKCAAIVSPAGKPDQAELEQGIFFLEKCGIQVKVMPHAFGSKNTLCPYLAATDQERAADFTEAYLDKDVDIIFASRGGYGCGRILPLLNWEKLIKAPKKIVAGYSDLTSLFFAMTAKNCGTPLASIMAAKLWSCSQRELLGIFDACSKTKKNSHLMSSKPETRTEQSWLGISLLLQAASELNICLTFKIKFWSLKKSVKIHIA